MSSVSTPVGTDIFKMLTFSRVCKQLDTSGIAPESVFGIIKRGCGLALGGLVVNPKTIGKTDKGKSSRAERICRQIWPFLPFI